ncbi:MAG: DnaJ domain-containing protein, partial [bacterium]
MPVKTGREYYEVLGVTRQASLEEIKKRYRELARQFHPDVNPPDPDAAQRFSEVSAAYRTLSD